MKFENRTFTNTDVELDGNEYLGCTIQKCKVIYRGGGLPVLKNSTFIGSQFVFEGAAMNVLTFLKGLYALGARDVVEGFFTAIRGQSKGDTRLN